MDNSKVLPALIETVCNTIQQSFESFAESEPLCNSKELTSEVVSAVSAGLARSLMEGGRAGVAQFIEAHDSDCLRLERDGRSYTYKQSDSKEFLTILGPVSVSRRRYCCWKGGASIVPLDEAWQMNGRYATPEVTEQILLGASMLTAGEVEELFGRVSPYAPSASLVQDLLAQDGAALGKFLSVPSHAAQMRPLPETEQPATVLTASMDGANILLRERGKKPGRPAERPGPEAQKQEGPTCYKNCMVGSVSLYKQVEAVLDIETGEQATVPERVHSVYHARMPEQGAATFKEEFEGLVARTEAALPTTITKILLMDGARPLWNYAQHAAQFAGYKMLVDFFHASEHLSQLAEALFGKSSEEARKWYEKWRHKLKHSQGAVEGLLRSAQRYMKQTKLTRARREEARKQQTFFKRNRPRLNYHEFVSAGLPIGSGPVEAACKTIVKQRFCRSGMRWSRAGGQKVMNLRVLHQSGQWAQAWAHYRANGGYHAAQGLSDGELAA